MDAINKELHGGQVYECDLDSLGEYQFYIRCSKHPRYVQAFASTLLNYGEVSAFIDIAQRLINSCWDCEYNKALDKTRFPEGAEL